MRNLLQKWVDTEPKVLVQGVQLTVAPCSVLPLDEGGEECPVYPISEPHVSSGLSVPLIGGAAGGGVLLICVTLLLIVIVVGMKRRHSKREQRIARYVCVYSSIVSIIHLYRFTKKMHLHAQAC